MTLIFFVSCGKESKAYEGYEDCIYNIIRSGEYVWYHDEIELGCNFYIIRCEYEGLTTFTLNNACIDMEVFPLVCKNEVLQRLDSTEQSMIRNQTRTVECRIIVVERK